MAYEFHGFFSQRGLEHLACDVMSEWLQIADVEELRRENAAIVDEMLAELAEQDPEQTAGVFVVGDAEPYLTVAQFRPFLLEACETVRAEIESRR